MMAARKRQDYGPLGRPPISKRLVRSLFCLAAFIAFLAVVIIRKGV